MFHPPSSGRAPNPVDIHVGFRLRQLRKAKGLTQAQLAEAIGVTFQQVQKYERGANRLSASKLFEAGKVLNASPTAFFEGLIDRDVKRPAAAGAVSEQAQGSEDDPLATAVLRIECPATRAALLHLIGRLTREGSGPGAA